MNENLRERERERERVIKGWQVCFLACTLAIFACFSFGTAAAFADETEATLNADTSNVLGGDTLETAVELPLNTTNTFTLQKSQDNCYYKIVLNQDGYLHFPSKFKKSNGDKISNIAFYHSDGTKFWGDIPEYDGQDLGLGKGVYYLRVSTYGMYVGDTVSIEIDFTAADNWEKESNDSYEEANEISLNKTYYGSHAENSYVDYYKFYVSGTKNVYVTVWGNTGTRIMMYLHKDNVSHDSIARWYQYANSSGDVNDKSRQTLTEGWYYLKFDTQVEYHFQINATGAQKADVQNVTVYRLYNKWNGEHLFTSDTKECDKLESIGWKKEGEAWKSPSTSSKPVYRLYNPYTGDHHYTADEGEYNTCGRNGWKQEGVAWYSDENEGMPVYRLYNKYATAGTHHYTTSEKECNDLKNIGWTGEGEGWYGLK
jgi:hypothetical protein